MRDSKVVAACIFNELQAVCRFVAFDGVSTHTDPFTSGKKYRKLVNNAVSIHNESLFFVSAAASYECIPIRAHAVVATQCMPWGLSNTDYRIWENISHVGLWGILRASIRGI